MNKNKSIDKTAGLGVEKIFKSKDMAIYSEIVRIIGEQSHLESIGEFSWTLVLEDCEFVEIEIILTFIQSQKIMLEIYEVEPQIQAGRKINYDTIYTLMGYACSQQIELKHNGYLHIKGQES